MRCPQCNSENRDTRKFCGECGQKLVIICPHCSSENLPDEKFCGECGHDLRKPKGAPAIDYQHPRSYTPKFLADKILASRSAIEGERKLVTVLFADVAGFTAISEKLDPEDVHEIMDGCFRILMDEIHRFEGTVNEFRGDGIMALFGAPIAHEDHAQRACHAALAIQQALIPYGERLQKRHGVDFRMRIGLNSGPVVVGAIGDDLRMDYTAQGDTANLAARMESNAPTGGVLVSNHIYRQAKEFFEFDPVGKIHVKGKEEPLEAYRLIQPTEVETRIEASAAKGLTRFVGRKRELETLKDAFEKTRSGEGQVVGVVGEAGVGKSRLLLEFRNSLSKGEYIYLEGRCLHYGSSMPYLPILDAFRTYLGIKEGEKESVIKQKMQERIVGSDESLTRCLPPIQELFSLKVDDEEFTNLEPKLKREKTFEAIRDILIRGSQSRPIVWAFEDLHWIDKTTEEFLDYLIGWLPGSRILLILLYRPEYTHQWGSKSYYSKVGVGQLSSGTSVELVQAILAGGNVVSELRELILNRASGNPLFVEELTHTLLENGSVQKKDDRYILVRNASEIQVPDTIQGIIAARMDRLEESLKRIMQVASVIGREFAFRILQAITEMKEDLKSNLLDLQGLEFIYEKSLFPELEYIFRHALTQEVAYNSLLLKRRKEIHHRIGQAIEELYSDRLEEFYEMLAYHYGNSDNRAKALAYAKLSGNKATRKEALWEAFQFFRQAVEVLKQYPDTDENRKERISVFLSMGTPMQLLGQPHDSVQLMMEAEKLAEEIGDKRALAAVHGWKGLYQIQKGGPLSARESLAHILSEAEKARDVEWTIQAAFDLSVSFCASGDWTGIMQISPRMCGLLEQTGHESEFFGKPSHPYSIFTGFHALGLTFSGDFENGARVLDKAFDRVKRVAHLYTTGLLEMFRGLWFAWLGDGNGTIKHCRQSIKLYEEAQARLFLPLSQSTLAFGFLLLGDTESAEKEVDRALQLYKEIGTTFWLSANHYYQALIHLHRADPKTALALAKEAVSVSERIQTKLWEGRSKALLGRILGMTKDSGTEAAEELLLEGIRISEDLPSLPDSSIGTLCLGEFYADTGRRKKALESLKTAETNFRQMGMDYWLGKTQEALASL